MDDLLELTGQAEATHFWFQGFRRFVAPVLDQVANGRRDLRLIDCGCGTGNNLALLRPYGRVHGFDLTSSGARSAAAHGEPVLRADITGIPFASDSFDVATAFDVLQCVPADARAISEMARIVRPAGAVVLTLAAFDFLRGDHAEAWHEVRRYTSASARALVEGAGLRVERLSFMFGSIFPLMLAARTTQRVLRPFRELRPDRDTALPPAPINAALAWLLGREASVSRYASPPIGSSILIVGRK